MNKETLAEECRNTEKAASTALAWLADNSKLVRQDGPVLARDCRRYLGTARRLTSAVERPMCVGVFGPSQSGKSYLISALARVGTRPLIAEFDGLEGGIDFVRQINPEGQNKESTGLVTRFSIRRQKTPAGFPVAMRILSQTDLVKILGNAYFSDCDLSEEEIPAAAQIAELLQAASASARPAPVDPLCEDDIFDLQEYFEQRFKSEPRIKALQASGYWAQAAELAPRLPLQERAKLWALLWGQAGDITGLYSSLYTSLEQLGFAGTAYCSLDALVTMEDGQILRRKDSIIDVDTLTGLGNSGSAALAITAPGRAPVSLPRANVTALVAEIYIAMRERPWPFFEHTDLLDFPGARSREITPAKYLKESATLERLFLRGKVAYLFQRYCAEQELTSMLLCIGPGNQEVRTLPGIVKEWIDTTHGPDASTRAQNQTALFLVLTKLDAEFQEGVGAGGTQARWSARLDTSLLGFFGNVHDWPSQWHPGQAFNNTYWLRNPNFLAKHILEYGPEPTRTELGVRPSELPRLADARESYLADKVVKTHFADPSRAWDEAFRLNDGGVSYLAERLAPVCNPNIKLTQIATRLRSQKLAMHQRLAPYFVSGDLAEQRAVRIARAEEVVKALTVCANARRFGKFISVMQLPGSEIEDLLYRVKTEADLGSDVNVDTLGSDRETRYAEAIVTSWLQRLRTLPETPALCRHFFLAQSNAEQVVNELAAGAKRRDLRTELRNRLRDARTIRRPMRDSIARPALIAAECVNKFVTWLGFDSDVVAHDRPRVGIGSESRDIFAPTPVITGMPSLGTRPERHDLRFAEDWFGAYRAMVDSNAMEHSGQLVDLEQNRRLGEVIALVDAQ